MMRRVLVSVCLTILAFAVYYLCVSEADGCFVLAFARRNVKIDDVLEVAATAGLQHLILDRGISDMEPIYCFTAAPASKAV
jgi:hypothetical protein